MGTRIVVGVVLIIVIVITNGNVAVAKRNGRTEMLAW